VLTRRRLLGNMVKVYAGLAIGSDVLGSADASPVLHLNRGAGSPIHLPANFIGLGYEMSSVAPLGLLSASNALYVELVMGLGREGVFRVGGIVANYTRYEPNGTIKAEPQNTVITRASLEQFSAFLEKTGWSAIWSVNFARGSVEEAVEEVRAVAAILGPRLVAIELGNEVEAYQNGEKPWRKPPYTYEAYRAEYSNWHAAIVMAVPGVPFAAPDTAADIKWVERMAVDAKGTVQLLTTHYYRAGQNRGSAEELLRPDPRLMQVLQRLRFASKQSGIPWRMCETNSFSGGGLPGVSDTFLAALWTLDYMLLLAEYGCSGVNIETGVNQLGFVSYYSPIEDDGKGLNWAGASYYGMLAFAAARRGCTEVMPVDVQGSADGLTAYALGAVNKVRTVVVINRRESDASVSVAGLGLGRPVAAMRLRASTATSSTGMTFGGSSVDASGIWPPPRLERVSGLEITVPRMSAVVVRD
jgi:hypothetical protein